MGIVVGGIVPAILIGVALIFLKLSAESGLSSGIGMVLTGVGVSIIGAIGYLISGGVVVSKGIVFSLLVGLFWGLGTMLMGIAVEKFSLPMSVAASLAATNILVVTAISVIFLGEGANISLPKLILGVLLVVAGSILVTTS